MLIGAALLLTWLVLLLKYPRKALPISLAAIFGLMVLGLWVLVQQNRDTYRLARLEMRLEYAPEGSTCPADRPLRVTLHNGNDVPLTALQWRLAAFAPGDSVNLVEDNYDTPRYHGPGDLQPDQRWQDCLPLPPLRSGYAPDHLQFRPDRLNGSFSD